MEPYLSRIAPQMYAVLRIVAGVSFALHGTQKLFGFPGDEPPTGDTILIVAGVLELACGSFVAVGFYARWAALLSSGLMAVAYFWRHAPEGLFPVANRGEVAVLYCFIFLFVATHGPGIWSADTSGARDGSADSQDRRSP